MKLPSAEEYLQIVDKKDPGNLATLYNHSFILQEDGKTYLHERSRNNIVFKSEYHSKYYAVRFFLNDDDELFRRYHQIQAYLSPKNLSWSVPFRFMDEEYYPVILMDWIDSLSFTDYLDLIIDDPSLITALQQKLVSLSRELEANEIGHGNLNMKHIRFAKQDHALKLIDYDSMFIPAFEERDSFSAGTAGFQHPMRLASDFSKTIDRFSFWIFLAALEAFKTDASLWKNAKQNRFDKEEQILFTYRDIAFSKQSAIFETLRSYNNAALNFYCDKLIAFCNSPSLDEVEAPRFYEESSTSSFHTSQPKVEKLPEPRSEVFTKRGTPDFENVAQQQTTIPIEKTIVPGKENKTKETIERIEEVKAKKTPELIISATRKRKKPVALFIILGVLLISAIAYLAWNNGAKKENTVIADLPKPAPQIQQPVEKKEVSFFTSTNITQFLFQLYQSYNKRDLAAILSNYADSVSQYYDAGAMPKNKLGGVINNLFIKPEYYECHPDLTTLHFNALGDSCKLSISINETIKADKRSKTENYSSKLEYIVDTAFKIMAEKNVQ